MRFNTKDISMVSALQVCTIHADKYGYTIGEFWINPRTGNYGIEFIRKM